MMRKSLEKISYCLARVAVVLFFGAGMLLSRCANPMAPQGGPKDSLPPVVVYMDPAYGTTDFTGKRIFIEFDEYVKLKNQQKEFYTSPVMKTKPLLRLHRKGIMVDIQDTLLENTTYALNFGSSIEDNNEGNPLNGFRYVFSTGDVVDSMVMSGYTVDAFKRDSASKSFIYFFAREKDPGLEYDSTLFNQTPDVVARAENNGIFIAENLKPMVYRIYAFQDKNDNQMYEAGIDNVGFLDSVYHPAEMSGFDVWYDTMRKYVTATPQLYFRMFRDEAFKRQVLNSNVRPLKQKAVLSFGAPNPQIDSIRFDGIDPSRVIVEKLKPTGDSLAYWFNVPAGELPDSITGEIVYMGHDSVRNLERMTKSFALVWKPPAISKQQERELEQKEKARQEAIAKGEEPEKEPNPFKYNLEAQSTLNPEKNIAITFDYPLIRMDSLSFSLVREEGEKRYRTPMRIIRDSLNIRRWIIRADWTRNLKYTLEIPQGALENVACETNDTIRTEFTVMDPDKYAVLEINLKGKAPDSEYVLQLTNESGETITNEILHAVSGKYVFNYVEPGNVRLRIVEDMNCNGKWDAGNLVERRQPERVELFIQETGDALIATKAGWTMAYDLDMNEIFAPVDMEKVAGQIRKAEEIRMRKYLEEQAKKASQPQQNRQQSSGQSFNPTGGFNMGR